MHAGTSPPGGVFATAETIVLPTPGEAVPGVASLDSPAVQQTKSEIRSLAAELAQLAHAGLEPVDFYDGFLPRLCVAMGAKGAGVWRIASSAVPYLVAEHALPAALLISAATPDHARNSTSQNSSAPQHDQSDQWRSAPRAASEAHQRILQCVAAEGQPILVPPGSVKLDTQRPTNPLSDALIVIPLRPEENVEYLLEVVQRPSGGPAAQRGYLRFVAQMGDLMADYLRRQQLRKYAAEHARLERIEDWLTNIAMAPQPKLRPQRVADALADLFQAERAVILVPGLGNAVIALSGARSFDPRSEAVLAAQSLYRQYCRRPETQAAPGGESSPQPLQFQATNRRSAAVAQPPSATPGNDWQAGVDQLCDALACRHGIIIPLDESAGWTAILAFDADTASPLLEDGEQAEKEWRVLRGLGGLLHGSRWGSSWLQAASLPRLLGLNPAVQPLSHRRLSLWARVQYWLLRTALLGLVLAIAFFPVSQQIAATAVLQPLSKQMYYAPAAGIVSQVLVDEGEAVASGVPLLQLTSHELETQAENLRIELKKTRGQIAEKTNRLNRGEAISWQENDQLEFDLDELKTAEQALTLQRVQNAERLAELAIVARQSGTVSTWDLRNRLLHHPVQTGHLLASTFDPDGQWRLLLSIPDYRSGLVAAALQQASQGAVAVHFSLASHPDQVLQAYAVDMAPQVTVLNDSASSTAHVVKTVALIRDSSSLPLKKDGAIARATIDCGKVPLCWLVLRDAYWTVSSRLRMFW